MFKYYVSNPKADEYKLIEQFFFGNFVVLIKFPFLHLGLKSSFFNACFSKNWLVESVIVRKNLLVACLFLSLNANDVQVETIQGISFI